MPESFLNKVAGLRPATLLKKTLAQVFSCEFREISKNTFFKEHLWATASLPCHFPSFALAQYIPSNTNVNRNNLDF